MTQSQSLSSETVPEVVEGVRIEKKEQKSQHKHGRTKAHENELTCICTVLSLNAAEEKEKSNCERTNVHWSESH